MKTVARFVVILLALIFVSGGVATVYSSGQIKAPTRVKGEDPVYPESARAKKIPPRPVVLEATFSKEGKIEEAKVVKSAHPILDKIALKAVKGWEYTPLVLNGVAVEYVIIDLTVNFVEPPEKAKKK